MSKQVTNTGHTDALLSEYRGLDASLEQLQSLLNKEGPNITSKNNKNDRYLAEIHAIKKRQQQIIREIEQDMTSPGMMHKFENQKSTLKELKNSIQDLFDKLN